MRTKGPLLLRALALAGLALAVVVASGCGTGSSDDDATSGTDESGSTSSDADTDRLTQGGLETDFSEHSVDLDLFLGGGPAKDGIPALTDPVLESVGDADADQGDDTLGILVDFEGERRFYPFSILVWHEVVNDKIGTTDFAVTF